MVVLNAVVEFLPLGLAVSLLLAGVLFVRIGRERRRRVQAREPEPNSLSQADRRLAIVTLGMWVGPILGIFAVAQVMVWQVRHDVAVFLDHVASDAIVEVDGRPRADGPEVVRVLQSLAPLAAHHSHPINRIDVRVESGGRSLELVLGRDSQVPDEYWVFDPRYSALDQYEVGRVTTKLFDADPAP